MDKKYIDEYRARAQDIISKMTLDEKLSMLTGYHPPIERLGLKEYHIGAEVARGYVGRSADRVSTVFPQPVGLAATFDKELMLKLGEIAADEARAYYNPDQRGGIALWGPTVDMARDPRWGRNEEAYGEDVCLTGEMSRAYTEGMAGDNGRFLKSIPTLKHFCANNNEADRGSCDAYLPLRLKHEYYYAAFENAIVNGGAKSLMTAYNEINGCPAILNPELQTIIKDKWGLWYTVSDGGDFSQTVGAHRFVDSHSESFALSNKAGADSMTDNGALVRVAAKIALDEGRITEADLNRTIECTLMSRFALGQFDECEYNNIGKEVIDCEDHKKTNLRAALEQVVLLKNNGLLPIEDNPSKIAVLGPLADENLMDWYTGISSYDISVLEAMKEEFNDSEVVHDSLWDHVAIKAPNGKYLSVDSDGLLSATAKDIGENEILELQDWGENWLNLFSINNRKYVKLFDDGSFRLNNHRVYDWYTRETLNFKSYGDKVLIEEFLHHRRMFCSSEGDIGVRHGTAAEKDMIFEVEVISRGVDRGRKIASECGFVLYCTGNHPVQVAKECYDRRTLALNIQNGMALELADANPRTVMAVISSYPYSIVEEQKKLPTILWSSHAGMFLGTAIAKTVRGVNNPAARLCQTWYRTENELPSIMNYDIESAGSTYMYFKGEPLYPFGHGLSYSEFKYSGFSVRRTESGFEAEMSVKNVSERDGSEVVQIYFTVEGSEVRRPIKKLCGFERINIKAGETASVKVHIPERIVQIFDVRRLQNITEGGRYRFFVGASSRDIRLESTLEVKGDKLGMRPKRFSAESFDSAVEVKTKYSKMYGHYLRGVGWSSRVVYGGIDFCGKRSLIVRAAGGSRIGIEFPNGDKKQIMTPPANKTDVFTVCQVEIPENLGLGEMKVSLSEGGAVLDFELK